MEDIEKCIDANMHVTACLPKCITFLECCDDDVCVILCVQVRERGPLPEPQVTPVHATVGHLCFGPIANTLCFL